MYSQTSTSPEPERDRVCEPLAAPESEPEPEPPDRSPPLNSPLSKSKIPPPSDPRDLSSACSLLSSAPSLLSTVAEFSITAPISNVPDPGGADAIFHHCTDYTL